MEQLQLISNLDYLRAQNRLEEYVNQYYFFLEQAIQQRDMASVHELLTAYLREVFYSDKRERLEALLQQLEETIIAPEYEQYQPNFYLIKGNLHYFSLNFERAHEEYKKGISIATARHDFLVIGVALNNMLAAEEKIELTEKWEFSTMPPVLVGMIEKKDIRRQYMLLILHIELALERKEYTYAENLTKALRHKLRDSGLILREVLQLELLQLRIYKKSGETEQFFSFLHSLTSGWDFQYDLQSVAYEMAVDVAKAINDEELAAQYATMLHNVKQEARASNAQIQTSRDTTQTDHLMPYMLPFTTLQKKANRHITRGRLTQYSIVMIHITQQELSDDDVQTLKGLLHEAMLPAKLQVLYGCTVVSDEKIVYVLKMTEASIKSFLDASIQPIVKRYREQKSKSFRVLISYVQNDLYGYETFEQALQHAYALVYYASYNGKGTLLNA